MPLGACLFLIYLAGCATSTPPATPSTSPVATPQSSDGAKVSTSLNPIPPSIRAELSSNEVAAGTLVRVTLHLSGEHEDPKIQTAQATQAAPVYPVTGVTPAIFVGEFEGITFPFFTSPDLGPQVFEAVLGIPYERKSGPGVIQVSGASAFKIPLGITDGHYPSEVLHVDARRVNPTKKMDLIRIKRDLAEVALIYKRLTPQKFWTGPFSYPIESAVTSPFGSRRLYNGSLKNYHPGMDLRAPMRTPVYSAAAGIVVLARNLFYTGNTVMLDHGYGVITLYAHMTKLKVKKGDLLEKHKLLGLSGQTGRVSGPHLHWQAVVHHVKVNPIGLTQVMR